MQNYSKIKFTLGLKQTIQIVRYSFEIMLFVAKKLILYSKYTIWVYFSGILH